MTEHDEQVCVVEWARVHVGRWPVLDLLFAIPNGAKLSYRRNKQGVRYSPEANRLLEEGLRPGVPDLFLPAPSYAHCGLFIEMKVGKNKPTEEQVCMIARLRANGYRVEVCYGYDQAVGVLEDYLGEVYGVEKHSLELR